MHPLHALCSLSGFSDEKYDNTLFLLVFLVTRPTIVPNRMRLNKSQVLQSISRVSFSIKTACHLTTSSHEMIVMQQNKPHPRTAHVYAQDTCFPPIFTHQTTLSDSQTCSNHRILDSIKQNRIHFRECGSPKCRHRHISILDSCKQEIQSSMKHLRANT